MRVFTLVRFTVHLPACSEVRRDLWRGRLLLPLKVRGLVVVHLPVHRLPAMNRTNSGVKLACVASVYAWFKSKKRPRNGIFGHGRARDLQFFTTPSPLFYSRHFSRGPCSLFRCHSDMCIPVIGVSPYTYP